MSLLVGQVINRALILLGELVGGGTPAADVSSDMLIAANAMKRGWFGTLIGPRLSPLGFASGATSGQAETGGEYQIAAGAAFTLTAPLNPRGGARFGAVDAALAFGTYACTVQGNGRLIAPASGSAASSVTLSANGQNTRWWFRGDAGTWIVEQDWSGLTSAIEFPDPIIAYMPHMLAVEVAPEFGADITPDLAQGAMEGRQALARNYARRGVAGLDPVIGLAAAAPAQPQGR
jgi:hypothetical protein